MKNIRDQLKFVDSYYTINREERNLTAILYHLLLKKVNMVKFLEFIKYDTYDLCKVEIYYEYSMLRDLWFDIGKQTKKDLIKRTKKDLINLINQRKKDLILESLDLPNNDDLINLEPKEFNEYFGSSKSKKNIVSPSLWNISNLSDKIKNDEFLNICKFKWSFKIIPDIVIHISSESAICIECKLESDISTYNINKTRDLEQYSFSQTEMQKYLMENILGYKTKFVLITKTEMSDTNFENVLWKDVFKKLEYSDKSFVGKWINYFYGK